MLGALGAPLTRSGEHITLFVVTDENWRHSQLHGTSRCDCVYHNIRSATVWAECGSRLGSQHNLATLKGRNVNNWIVALEHVMRECCNKKQRHYILVFVFPLRCKTHRTEINPIQLSEVARSKPASYMCDIWPHQLMTIRLISLNGKELGEI